MATLADTNPTMLDLVKALDPSGGIAEVAEILNQTNEGLDEMTWQEGNLLTGHRHSVRTGLPSVTWGQLYKGVKPSKGTRAQVTDNTGFIESLSETDKRLVDMAPDPMKFRAQEDRPHVEAMSQEFFRTLFKGTVADTDKFIGLEARFNSKSAANGENILNTGIDEDTDVTSLWLIGWSPRTIFGIVPKNSKVGLQQEDHGTDWITDADGGKYQIYRTYWRWDCGLAMPDWRYVVRAQVDHSELTDDGSSGVVLPLLMRDMIAQLPGDAFGSTRLAFYMNRRVMAKWAKQMEARVKNSTLLLSNAGAVGPGLTPRMKHNFDGIPLNRVDVLIEDEVLVV